MAIVNSNRLRLKIELAAAATIGVTGVLLGTAYTNPSGVQKYIQTALGSAVASAGVYAVVSALTSPVGSLRLELGKVQTKARVLEEKLDKEAIESAAIVQICDQLQTAATAHQFELTEAADKVQAAEKLASEWHLAAAKGAEVARVLNEKIEALQASLEDSEARFGEELSKAVHLGVKKRNVETASRLYGNYQKHLEEQATAAKEACDLEIARHQARVDELKRESEELQSKLENLGQEKDELTTVFDCLANKDLPDIQATFEREWTENDRALQLAIEALQKKNAELQAPRLFPGTTGIDATGNRIINHFAAYEIVLDAIEAVSIPTGFRLRFKCDRTGDFTKLTEDEFDKRTAEPGLMGLSHAPLDFVLDTRNFIVSVEIVTVQAIAVGAIEPGKPASVAEAVEAVSAGSSTTADAFRALGCFPAAEFEAVIRDKFVPRVRVVAGSTGGKSPLMELISVAIAKQNQGELWLLNPLPGSPKDWFSVPGLIEPGGDPTSQQIEWMESAHRELNQRRSNLGAGQKFIMVMADEVNALARQYENLGVVLKDFYQLSDHAQMGIITAGQGANVSGVSGGSKAGSKTGNAGKLMDEDFQNATQVFTAQAAGVWLKKHRKDLEPTLKQLEKLCSELNQAKGLSPRPKPGTKVVDRSAYRVALVVSPASDEPFFIQIPAYSFYADKMDGVSFPVGAQITAPYSNQVALGLKARPEICPHCGSTDTKQDRILKTEIKRQCKDCKEFYRVPKTDAAQV